MIKPPRATVQDASMDVLRCQRNPLDAIFAPRSVAVIGATDKPGSVGRTILWNLMSTTFGGTIYPVNPTRASVLGIKAYPRLSAISEPVDLAVLVTPAPTVPGLIGECVGTGVEGAIIISAGFKEIGPAGAELERQVRETARGHLRIVGPNCLGVMNPVTGLNATFATTIARPGSVGFISQSGALCTAILDWSLREHVGFSAFVSVGSMLDVGWGDLIQYLGDDPRTASIVIYMESIGDARSFLTAAREVALTKPIIVIKPGRTAGAAKAAASHTGALTGSDEVLEVAFRRSGVLRVHSIADLFSMASILAKQPRPKGRRLTILTNAGGPGVLATDALLGDMGELSELSGATTAALSAILPAHWSHANPIDILGDAGPERYAKALEITAADPGSDGLLVILTPQAMTDPTRTAEALKPYGKGLGKPILASWMGGADVAAGEAILNQAGIPCFDHPDTAARMFNYMWRYDHNLRALYQTPAFASDEEQAPDRERVRHIIEGARRAGRTILSEVESKQIAAAYGLPVVDTRLAADADEAVAHAQAIGYPVVVKLHSLTITHKSDVGGVRLGLRDEGAVRAAFADMARSVAAHGSVDDFQGVSVQPMIAPGGYELILGSSPDAQFGPVLLVGAGGTLVEILQDRALALPPLNTTLARRMLERTRIFKALLGTRGRAPVDIEALGKLLVRFSQLVVEQPWVREIDINPLLATPPDGRDPRRPPFVALDARVVLHDPATLESALPRPAIRPYPVQYVRPWKLRDGTAVNIRPIRPEDEPMMVHFHESLSEHSVYMRYFRAMKLSQRVAHERLTRICFIDYQREMALVTTLRNPESGERRIIGVGRLSRLPGTDAAEFSVLIADDWQRLGLGTELLDRLIQVGRDEHDIREIVAFMLPDNAGMQQVCRRLGFEFRMEDAVLRASLDVGAPARA